MRVLGISDGMNGGVALIEDGKLRYVVQEERLTRKKMATGFPSESISKVLQDTGIRPSEIDAVAVATINEFFREPAVEYDGWLMREQTLLKELMLGVSSVVTRVGGAPPFLKKGYYEIKTLMGGSRRRAVKQKLRDGWGVNCPVEFINHHLAHACSTYFTSGFDDATVITMDGAGDNDCSHVYEVRNGQFQRLWQVDSFDSVGNYYAYVTHLCGFKAQKHEGKITGLAAYGEPTYLDRLREFVTYRDGSTANTGQVFYWAAVKALQKALPDPFSKEDLAASVQKLLEEVCCSYVGHWVTKTGLRNVAVAGGVFANVKLNQYIHELEHVDSVFIHPGMGDEGLAVGAALALAARQRGNGGPDLGPATLDDVYFGPGFGEEEIAREIEREGLEAEYVKDIERRIAELLAQGRVVARFDGRLEYGPRALGNRSVLYQPTDPSVNDWLNKKLRRTEFMPFAPVTLEGYADQCYEGMDGARYPAQFMTITFDCTKWMKETCPAVVHVDGTARPQTINERTNPSYYRIVDEYRKLTGLPSIINTSFNMHEEPIVCTPNDAIRAYLDGGLDYLAMDNFLLENKRSDHRPQN